MNEEDESGLLPNGEQALTEGEEYDDGDYGDYGDVSAEGEEDEESSQEEDHQGEVAPITTAQLGTLGPVATAEEVNELAAELGFTPQQFAKAAQFFGRIAQHNVAAAGISNTHLQAQVAVAPGLRSHLTAIQRNLHGLSIEAQTQPKYVKGAIVMSFVEGSPDTEDIAGLVRRITKAVGVPTAASGRAKPEERPQSAEGGPTRTFPASPAPTASGGGGRTKPTATARQRQAQEQRGTGAAAFLASQYPDQLNGVDFDAAKDQLSGRRRWDS